MNDDEKRLFTEITEARIEMNTRITKLMTLIAVVFALLIVAFGVTTSIICVSYNNATVEMTRLYFETDYDYGDITQSTDVQIGE